MDDNLFIKPNEFDVLDKSRYNSSNNIKNLIQNRNNTKNLVQIVKFSFVFVLFISHFWFIQNLNGIFINTNVGLFSFLRIFPPLCMNNQINGLNRIVCRFCVIIHIHQYAIWMANKTELFFIFSEYEIKIEFILQGCTVSVQLVDHKIFYYSKCCFNGKRNWNGFPFYDFCEPM